MFHLITTRRAAGILLASLLLSALPGCQLWNGWLDMIRWRGPGAEAAPKSTTPKMLLVATPPGPGITAAMIQRVTLYRITVPVGTFTTNDKAWAQLNEDAIDSKTAVLMAQNGLHAAIGATARWPVISKILDAPGATMQQMVCQTDGRSAINVITHASIPDQIVVSVDRDLQQQGRTFENCDNGFRLTLHGITGKAELVVQLEPVVTLGTMTLVRGTPGMVNSSVQPGFTSEETFSDLRMAATLGQDQFLVLTAIDPRSSRFSVGTLWLSDLDKVPATETLLVFVPGAK